MRDELYVIAFPDDITADRMMAFMMSPTAGTPARDRTIVKGDLVVSETLAPSREGSSYGIRHAMQKMENT
jgi:hypothetical protein